MSLRYALSVIIAISCLAQTFSSSISGLVTDPSGAVVIGATVELQNMQTNDVRKFTSLDTGSYQFNNLIPGTYQVTVTMPGFKTYQRQNLALQAETAATVNVSLEVGGTEQKVEVASSAVLVDTQTANNSAIMDQRLVAELPNNTRNPLNFVFALAGTTPAPGGQTQRGGTLDQMSSNFGLNGGRTGEEQVLIDGAPSQAADWGGLFVAPLQDSVQEQQVVVNTYDAQYGKAGAGVVSLVTRGGTNQFHGEAYDYLRNDVLDANYWANNKYDTPRGAFKRNQFGGNIGGPLWKSHNLFFFGGYEGLRQPQTQSSGLLTVPSQAQRSGDFSQTYNPDGSLAVIYNPFTTTAIGDTGSYTRQPFANNQIPQSLWNSVGAKMVNLYPLPNRPGEGPNQINNYYSQGAGNTLNDKFDARVDWAQNTKHRLFVRWSQRVRSDILSPCFFCNGADEGNDQADTAFQAVINDTITPNPTWVINAFISYGRWRETHTAVGYGVADAATIGLSPSFFQAPLLPTISADQYAYLGNGSYERYPRYSDTAQINVTKERAKHSLKFGFNFDLQMINNISEAPGSFAFSNDLTSCDPNPNGGPCTALNYQSSASGNAIASMLLGTADGGGQSINIDPAMSLHTYGAYLQDQWRVTSRLTINAGLRYENQRPATERFNRLTYFDPNATNPISAQVQPLLGRAILGAFEYANSNNRFAWPPNNHDFAPRMGVAFKITDKLVARAGAGVFFLPPSAMITFDNPGQFIGYSSSTSYVATTNNGYTPLNPVSNPFPGGIVQPVGSGLGALTQVGDGMGQIWLKGPHPTPYTEQWSFSLQYQLGTHGVLEANYTGNRGRKLLYGNPNLDADQLPTQFLSLGSRLDQQVNNPFYGIAPSYSYLGSQPTIAYNELLRPFPQYTYLQWTRSLPGASSQFDALNVKYTHSFSNGLSLLATYQWSKAMDNGPEDFFGWATGNQWRDYYHTNLDYNISTHDIPQAYTTAFVYELPYGKGKHFGNGAPAVVKYALGNWQISSVIRIASGTPLGQVFYSYSNQLNNYGFPGPQIADWVGNPVPAHRTPDSWIDPSGFTAPPSQYMYGNAPQRITQIRERSIRNFDVALAKNFAFTDRWRLQFRAEALNLTNYAQYNLSPFNTYPLCVTCGGFGQLDSTENDPRNIQFGLKLMF
ncbi:MAG: carboxypeptidase regulatory-like domain-containing protein [Bryobacteraceae bacterium]